MQPTPLFNIHKQYNAKIVDFAGYAMPLQYKGFLAEHHHTRQHASLFDVSHMGQIFIEKSPQALEKLLPCDLEKLKPSMSRYTFLTNEQGGIIDDLIINKADNGFYIVLNAGCKKNDIAHLEKHLDIKITEIDNALLALQGPKAAAILKNIIPECENLRFMQALDITVDNQKARISRTGYTGEDGFEISLPSSIAENFAQKLLAYEEVEPCGLGARDSLRLEAGLCLYGHDLDTQITPIEADLIWTIQKRRREQGGFLGDSVILEQLEKGVSRKRVGLLPEGKAPVREGVILKNNQGDNIGHITSGGFSPSLNKPIAMGYIETAYAKINNTITAELRGKPVNCTITSLPFISLHYQK